MRVISLLKSSLRKTQIVPIHVVFLCLSVAFAACKTSSEPVSGADTSASSTQRTSGKGEGTAAASEAAEPVSPSLPLSADRLADLLLAKVRTWIKRDETLVGDTQQLFEAKAAGQPRRWRTLVIPAYRARGYQPVTHDRGRLTDEGLKAIDLILDVRSHALKESSYPLKALNAAVLAYKGGLAAIEALASTAPDMPGLEVLQRVVDTFEPQPDETYLQQRNRVAQQLIKAALTDNTDHSKLLDALDRWSTKRHMAERELQTHLIDIELAVTRGFFQYALDFRYLKRAHPFGTTSADDIRRALRTYDEELDALFLSSADAIGTAMEALWPLHPYYSKAMAALARYRSLAEADAVQPVKFRGIARRRHKGKKVLALKARLAAQGYFDGDLNDPKYGADLVDAVKTFQRHHQLDVDGQVRDGPGLAKLTKTSLNVSMDRRVRTLELSLQRWRESSTHNPDEPFYFRVNIPQFEVEVWDGDELVRRHRIIVGNNKMEIDQDHGRKGYLNRTALISDEIERIVINPVWNVPERIRIQEILVEAAKDPEYMEQNGYKVRQLGNGKEQIYQEAGPTNALGRVKILFPNKHAIYMHDTPKRRLFRRTIRAFSHGCMRLKDPVEMATFLLERQGLMTKERIDSILDSKKERGVKLKEKIPIHIEYNTVAFDPDDDEPIFLNDIYRYDRSYWSGDLPLEREEKIPVVKTELPVPEWEEDPRADDTSPEAVEGDALRETDGAEATPSPARPVKDETGTEKRVVPPADARPESNNSEAVSPPDDTDTSEDQD